MSPQQQRIAEAFNVRGHYHGMGDVTSQQITSTVGGSIMAAAGPIALINPIAGAIVGLVGAFTSLIGGLFKPDLTKIQATAIVDRIEAEYLKPNLQRWLSAPASQKTVSAQAASLTLVDQALGAVQQGCSNPALGEAGQRCISERLVQGGTAPWCPTLTGCDWISLYRDPIANDPNVIPDPVVGSGSSVVGSVDSATSQVSQALGISPLAIGAALIGLALFLGSD